MCNRTNKEQHLKTVSCCVETYDVSVISESNLVDVDESYNNILLRSRDF